MLHRLFVNRVAGGLSHVYKLKCDGSSATIMVNVSKQPLYQVSCTFLYSDTELPQHVGDDDIPPGAVDTDHST